MKLNSEADIKVKELSKEQYQTLYDKMGIEISQLMPVASKVNELMNYHEWTLKQCKEDDVVLDVGCGRGYMVKFLRDKGCVPIGIDISNIVIEDNERDLPDCVFIKQDAEKIEFGDNYFDVVICNQVLEHVQDYNKSILEMIRVLKGGGKMIITVPIGKNLHVKSHTSHWDLYEIYDLFKSYGLKFKIHWLTKVNKYNEYDEPNVKNIFGIIVTNEGE